MITKLISSMNFALEFVPTFIKNNHIMDLLFPKTTLEANLTSCDMSFTVLGVQVPRHIKFYDLWWWWLHDHQFHNLWWWIATIIWRTAASVRALPSCDCPIFQLRGAFSDQSVWSQVGKYNRLLYNRSI